MSRDHMRVQMPNVLIAGGLVVLAHGHAITRVAQSHRNRNPRHNLRDSRGGRVRQAINVFVMDQRDDECVPWICGVPVAPDQDHHGGVPPCLEVSVRSVHGRTEWAVIASRRV